MVELFRRICRPIATEETPGAFLFGLRLMAIDGTREDLADTPDECKPSSVVLDRDEARAPFPRCAASIWSNVEPTPL